MAKVEKFLIVDDQDPNTLFFQVLLGDLGYSSIFTASHGHDGQVAAERHRPDFIICSWDLSGMPGTVFVQRLRSHRQYYNVPFLIYSKNVSEAEVQLIHELGLPDVLLLPVDREVAKQVISDAISTASSLTSDEVKFRKMEAAYATNSVDEALKLADHNLRETSPISYKVNTLLGEIYLATGAAKKAEEYLTKSVNANSDYLPAKYALAKLYSMSSRHEQAISLLGELADNSPLNVKTLLSLGSAYLVSGDRENARNALKKAEKIDPDCAGMIEEKTKCAVADGEFDKAKQFIDQMDSGDQLARDFNIMAISKVAGGEFEEGIEIYKKAIELLGGKAKTYLLRYNLGLAFKKYGKLKSAFVEFAKSYISEPTYEKAYSAIAVVHKALKEKGIKVGPNAIDKIKAARAKAKAQVEQHPDKAG